MALSTNVITKPVPPEAHREILFGVNALWEEWREYGATYLLWTVLPRSITNAPTKGNASMTIRGSCISVRVNKA